MAKIKFTNDIVSDSLTRIRNARRSNKAIAKLPNAKIVLELLKVLSNANFIGSYTINEQEEIEVGLLVENTYKFTNLQRVSKPGIRIYVGADELRPVKYGKGLAIVSTSKGIMSGTQAKKERVGGEYLCKIW